VESSETKRLCYVLNTRPLLNFTYTDCVDLLKRLLGRPIFVPAEVYEEWKKARSALKRKLRDLPARCHGPLDVRLLTNLNGAQKCFSGSPFRVEWLEREELELAEELRERHWDIDAGEADVLALCMKRELSWVAVLDDRPAHELALALGVPTMGTIDLLIEAVRQNLLSPNDGEYLLEKMKESWPRAPRGKLSEYLKGLRSIW